MEQLLIPQWIAVIQKQLLDSLAKMDSDGKRKLAMEDQAKEASKSLAKKKRRLPESEIVRACVKSVKATEQYKSLTEAKAERTKAVEELDEFTAWTDAKNLADEVSAEWQASKAAAQQLAYKLAGATGN